MCPIGHEGFLERDEIGREIPDAIHENASSVGPVAPRPMKVQRENTHCGLLLVRECRRGGSFGILGPHWRVAKR